jgi:hypothetical protein
MLTAWGEGRGEIMSSRIGKGGTPLWLVRRIGGDGVSLFVGSLHEVVGYINRLHRESGVQHAARELSDQIGRRFAALLLGLASWLAAAQLWLPTMA